MRFNDFELDTSRVTYALRDDRLVYDYVTNRRVRDVAGQHNRGLLDETTKREYIRLLAAEIAKFDDIDYDACSTLAGKLATQCVEYLAVKLDAAVESDSLDNCQRNNRSTLASCIRTQLMEHAEYDSAEESACVQYDFKLKANALEIVQGEEPRPFDQSLVDGEKSKIRNMVFSGFSKCLFTLQKFDSDPERAFSVILEREASVQKWFKPTLSNLRLYYGPNEYTPDFVVETDTRKLLVEVKASDQIDNAKVQLKKDAAFKWCHYANENLPDGGKTWQYLLIPDIAINSSLELAQAIRDYAG